MPSMSTEQIQVMTSANAVLQADKTRLEETLAGQRVVNGVLEQKIRLLQVTATILLASAMGLAAGMATSMGGAVVQTAMASASGVFFAVIMASMAILVFLHRSSSALSCPGRSRRWSTTGGARRRGHRPRRD